MEQLAEDIPIGSRNDEIGLVVEELERAIDFRRHAANRDAEAIAERNIVFGTRCLYALFIDRAAWGYVDQTTLSCIDVAFAHADRAVSTDLQCVKSLVRRTVAYHYFKKRLVFNEKGGTLTPLLSQDP